MAKAKAKWLEESTNIELLEIIKAGAAGDEKAAKKMEKAIAELIERTPETDELTVEESIELAKSAIEMVSTAYAAEVEAAGDEDDSDDEDSDEDEDDDDSAGDYDEMSTKELKAECKERGIKKLKGLKKDALIELLEAHDEENGDEDDSDDDDDSTDYSEMTLKDLKGECRERGIKVNKKDKAAQLIEKLEADDEE